MSSARIICIGEELLSGDVPDVHGSFIARFLRERGITVELITLVGDDYQAILGVLATATAGSDLVVITGGLGPTSDDRTRDALGLLVGQRLEFDESLWQNIQHAVGKILNGSDRHQAFRPALFQPLTNARGTAPGLIADVGGCRVVALPGPPHELQAMLVAHGERIIHSLATSDPIGTVMTCFGISESRLEDALQEISTTLASEMAEAADVDWHTRAEHLRILLRLTGADGDTHRGFVSMLELAFGQERFAAGESSLGESVISDLAAHGLTIAAAESCTGGLIGAALTEAAGSSKVFWGSIVTYANAAKSVVLGVSESNLELNGAVSKETVLQMARSIRSIAGTDLSIAVTGIAGPEGGTEEKPVGTVWAGLDSSRGQDCQLFNFAGDRGRVRDAALTEALLMVRSWVKEAVVTL